MLVACLCAAWCRTCDSYHDDFLRLGEQHPSLRFVWIDIEDEAELVDELDVETFPTLLIGQRGQLRFVGPVLPQIGAAQRLIQATLEDPGTATPTGDPATLTAAKALLARLLERR